MVLVHVGEPDPDEAAAAVRARLPHVWVGTDGNLVRVGPFVEPGRAPCHTCVAAHREDRSPGSALASHQRRRPVGVPEPVDPARMHLALAWAVSDAWSGGSTGSDRARGDRQWSSVARDPAFESWRRHPRCGCSWADPWLGRISG